MWTMWTGLWVSVAGAEPPQDPDPAQLIPEVIEAPAGEAGGGRGGRAGKTGVTPYFGVEWRPFSRADLGWVIEGRTSGTLVGEFDGSVRPLLSAFGGLWVNRWFGFNVGFGLARMTSTSSADDIYAQQHWGVARPSLDLRFGWMEQHLHRPIPWFTLGVHGDIPSSRDVSNGYTDEEQTAADASAETERLRLGGVGGRLGFGVDYRLLPGLMIGAQFAGGLHRSTFQGGDATSVSIWVTTEASLLLTFEWPAGGFPPPRRPPQPGRRP